MEFVYRAGGQRIVVRVERSGEHYRVRVKDRVHEILVRRAAGVALDLIVDGREVRALVGRDGTRRAVRLGEADPVSFERAERGAAAERAAAGPAGAAEPAAGGSLAAGMDGRVAAVLVREGDRVETGATLVVLEAMKMELRVTAPCRGRVRSLGCREGDIVERGRTLVELEPVPGPLAEEPADPVSRTG
jgi:3-methylcrotonyl-CoA carboxylase alpha subunit